MPAESADRPVDEVHSWARRRDDRLHLVLRLPGLDLPAEAAPTIQLTHAGSTVSAPAQVQRTTDATTLIADPPAAHLGAGVWHLAIGAVEGQTGPLSARLVLPEHGPVALLTGPAPRRRLNPRPRGGGLATRVVRVAGGVTEVVLRELPPERAVRYRRSLRRVARTVRR